MKAICAECKQERSVEPFAGLCVECLIARSKREKKPDEPKPFDPKLAAAGRESED